MIEIHIGFSKDMIIALIRDRQSVDGIFVEPFPGTWQEAIAALEADRRTVLSSCPEARPDGSCPGHETEPNYPDDRDQT